MSLIDDLLAISYDKRLEDDIEKAVDDFFAQGSLVLPPLPPEGQASAQNPEGQKGVRALSMKTEVDLLKQLLVSLLTLDWEITDENIVHFMWELEALKEKLNDDQDSQDVIEMALVVCNYLRVKGSLASPASMQFLHLATLTLQLFLQKQKHTSITRKEAMKRLLLKFESLKEDNESTKPRAAWPVRFQPQDVVSELSGGREAKVPARKTTPAKKRAAQTKKTKTATAEVLKTIERHKTGIDIAILKKKTGFPASTIRGIVYRAKKEGKIKRIGRGVYMAA